MLVEDSQWLFSFKYKDIVVNASSNDIAAETANISIYVLAD